jgi:FkbM family methyltransferase
MVEMTDKVITHEFRGQTFSFADTPTAPALIVEIFSDNYDALKAVENGTLSFSPGDVILDLGANEGMFSIMMAKLFPMTEVIALEPVPATYAHLLTNISLNGCANISSYNVGVGKPGQRTCIINVPHNHSGGSSSLFTFNPADHYQVEVGLISLDDAFEMYGIERCRLLKCDTEGAEYDIFYPSSVLSRVDYVVCEMHINRRLEFQSRRMDALATWIRNQSNLLHTDFCKMCE